MCYNTTDPSHHAAHCIRTAHLLYNCKSPNPSPLVTITAFLERQCSSILCNKTHQTLQTKVRIIVKYLNRHVNNFISEGIHSFILRAFLLNYKGPSMSRDGYFKQTSVIWIVSSRRGSLWKALARVQCHHEESFSNGRRRALFLLREVPWVSIAKRHCKKIPSCGEEEIFSLPRLSLTRDSLYKFIEQRL